MKDKPNYYSVIPANVRYDDRLRDKSKLLYGEISSLCNKNGYCTASNKYFAELYNVSVTTISTLIGELIKCGYLFSEFEYKEGTKEILNRYLKLFKDPLSNFLKDNNTSINNKENNNISNDILLQKKVFKKPTFNEVKEYCEERKNNIDADMFIDFYESNGWKVGKNSMKDWKAAVRMWEKRNKKDNNQMTATEKRHEMYRRLEEKYKNDNK